MPDKRLVVLDESTEPSPYFSEVKDPDVTYVHRVAQPRTDGLSRVGAARNAANALTPDGAILVHLDDDDILAPSYAAQMIDRLGDADLCKLDVWRILHEASGLLFEWDTRKVGDKHYALLGDSVAAAAEATSEITQEFMELLGVRDGFGFSLVYPRKTWERHPFPNEDTEDLPFVQSVRDAGGKIVFVSDLPHLVLHLVSKMSKIACYPQRLLGAAAAEKQARLRSAVAHRMIGAMGEMTELQAGKTISLAPGSSYSVLAEVKNKHSLRALTNRAERMGVTITSARDNVDASEFGAPEPADGYRLVLAIGSPSDPKMLPWKAPGFFATYDKSHVVKAWTGAGVSEGTKARSAHDIVKGRPDDAFGAGDVVERYDPARYAGKEPPHRCTRASSTAIARQIDPAWTIAPGSASGVDGMTEIMANVVTPMGPKTIPTWQKGQQMVLQCPYTGELFLFTKAPKQLGAARPLGAGATPSLAQLGMSAKGDALEETGPKPDVGSGEVVERRLLLGAGDAISTAASAQATLQNTQNLPSNLQQQFTDGVAQQQSSGEANAITAMIGLLEKGSFDPDSPADMQAVIDITAGALTACGLPEIAAALELLDAGAHAFASLMVQLGVFKLATGWSNGGKTWTAGDILQAWGWPVAQGSTVKSSGIFGITATSPGPTAFAQVAVPVFAKYAADAINAKPTPPFSLISEALVKLWNAASGGSTTLVFVPGFFAAGEAALGVPMVAGYGANDVFPLEIAFAYAPQGALPSPWISSLSDDSFMSYTALSTGTPKQQSLPTLPIHVPGPPVQNGKGGDTPAASKGLAVAGLLVAGAAVAAGVGIWGMSQGLGYGAAWKALGSKLAAQTTASGNLLLGARVPMLAAEKSRSRRARRRA